MHCGIFYFYLFGGDEMPSNFYLGIDVSKASLSVVLMSSNSKVLWSSKKIANQPSGFKQMVEHASKIASKHADGDDYSIKDCFKTCRRG